MVNSAKRARDSAIPIELRHGQLIDDLAGVVGMLIAGSGTRSQVSLKAVASVEKFADVLSDVVLNHELAARVEGCKALYVQDQLVEHDILAALSHCSFELMDAHAFLDPTE